MNYLTKNFGITSNTIETIGSFTILWAIFERNCCQNNCTEAKLSKLAKLLLKEMTEEHRKEVFDLGKQFREALGTFLQLTSELTESEIARRMYTNPLKCKPELVNFLKGDTQKMGKPFLTGLIYAVYRIRNNLLHGQKDEYQLNEQNTFFEYANQLLCKLAGYIFYDRDFSNTTNTTP